MRPSDDQHLAGVEALGGLNALTAFDTASMPVSEDPPLANARSSTKTIPNAIRPL